MRTPKSLDILSKDPKGFVVHDRNSVIENKPFAEKIIL
jgi:hypothetical protein